MTGEHIELLRLGDAELLARAIADPATPDFVVIRAVTALGDDPPDRLARSTAMGWQFVTDVRRQVAKGGAAAMLGGAPSARERVLDAATHQISCTGRPEVAIRAVSAAACVPLRTVYRLYAPAALIQTCQRRAQTIWRARFQHRVLAAGSGARERLFAVIGVIDDWVGSHRFRGDLALWAQASFAGDPRDDGLREHLAEIDRFATGLARTANLAAPCEFGAFVATSVAGATAWFDRRAEARAASVAVIERLIAASCGG
jgi:AcrR family transcriptional regulator